MKLNTVKSSAGISKNRRRVGRGKGCGWGKTAARGHKGQHSRSGGYHRIGFEGGQMPLARRLPKFGFTSKISVTRFELTLDIIEKCNQGTITLPWLKENNYVSKKAIKVKVIATGTLTRAITLDGVVASTGAKKIIEAKGGKII